MYPPPQQRSLEHGVDAWMDARLRKQTDSTPSIKR